MKPLSVSADPGRLRVTQVSYSFAHGGSERLACNLAQALRSTFDTSVVAIERGGPLAAELAAQGVKCDVIGRRPGLDWRVALKLYSRFRRRRPAVVVTHHLMQLIYAALPARLVGARLIHVEHEHFSLRRPRAQRELRALSMLCDAVVVPGRVAYDFLINDVGVAPRKVSVIPNGVDLRRYCGTPRVERRVLGLPEGTEILGAVGRLDSPKDHRTLLQAFAGVLAERRHARLVIVGDGPLRGELERAAAALGITRSVLFLGARSDVADILPHFDVFALSSTEEGTPMALLEAMACARPVVATAVGDVSNMLDGGRVGRLVPARDPAMLAAAVIELLEKRAGAVELGQEARRHVEEQFSAAAATEAYARLCRRAAAR